MKRLLLFILSIAATAALFACTPNNIQPNDPPDEELIYIVKDGLSEYSVVYKNTDTYKKYDTLAKNFAVLSAVDYEAVLERYHAEDKISTHEVLFGDTGRELSSKLKAAVTEKSIEGYHAWGYAYEGGKLAFYVSSEAAAELGYPEFEALVRKADGIAVTDGHYTIRGKLISEYEAEKKAEEDALKNAQKITLSGNAALTSLVPNASKGFCGSISAKSASYILTLPSKIIMTGDLTISNVTLSGSCTIMANGHKLEIASTVKSSSGRLTVYGGKESDTLTGDTNLVLLGGKYQNVYGGGAVGSVNGNTNIIFGGNANLGDGIDDSDSAALSPCIVWGGGSGGRVSGTANITIGGNAAAKFVVGAGSGSSVGASNINIEGGKIMNVVGAARGKTVNGMNVNIKMIGGLVESIFGGCEGAAMTGNVNIALLGGDVSRRVYAGCYNGYDGSFTTSHYVTGRLTVTIGPNAKLASGKELSSDNQSDMGIFASSRIGSRAQAEVGTVIFLDGCYSAQSGKLGAQCFWFWDIACSDSYHLYEINCTIGGDVYAYGAESKLAIMPDIGYKCALNGNNYLHSSNKSQNLYTLPSTSSVVKLDVNFTRQ